MSKLNHTLLNHLSTLLEATCRQPARTAAPLRAPRPVASAKLVAENTPEIEAEVAKLKRALATLSPDVPRGRGSLYDLDEKTVSTDYWLLVVWAIASLQWECGEGIAREWSMQSPRYSDDGFDDAWRKYDPSRSNAVGIGSLYKLAAHHGGRLSSKTEVPAINNTGNDEASSLVKDIVASFNKEHFVAMEGNSLWVYKEGCDAELKIPKLDRYRTNAFKDLHNQSILSGGKSRRIGEYWFSHPQRRAYVDGFAFLPKGNCPAGTYNLWKGFGVEPMKGSDYPILDYLTEVICDDQKINYEYLVNWLAYGIQNPEQQGYVAVVLRGGKGIGKSTLGRIMVEIYGRHGMHIMNSKHLVGSFNGHLRDKVFLFADEAFFAGDRQGEDVLKGLITEDRVTIEKKGVEAVTTRNRLKILMGSNHEWVVPTSADERRFFILNVSERREGDKAYWTALNTHIDDGGRESLLHYLQNKDLTNFDVRSPPNTTGLDAQKLQNLDAVESAVYQWLHFANVGTRIWGNGDELKISTEDAFDLIKQFCKDSPKHKYPPTIEIVGKKLKKLIGVSKNRLTDGAVYLFPPLADARRSFEKSMRFEKRIWDEDEDA